MDLPVTPPLPPMLAKAATALPEGEGWLYEPKWDGFRCVIFRDGDEVVLGSRNERPLTRYFPELLAPVREQLPERCVVDGEIVIPRPGASGLDFDALLQRIHPAESRVNKLAEETPAHFVAFDLVALGDRSLLDEPLATRRAVLDDALGNLRPPLHRGPSSTDPGTARDWFSRFEGAGLDGVVAKRLDGAYTPDVRSMVKVKHHRTADVVVAGYRLHKDGKGIGSLLLGLNDASGRLQHVGVAASFTAKQRVALLEELRPLEHDALVDHPWAEWASAEAQATSRMPGATSRWNAGKDLSWTALRPERVAEVEFDQLQGHRFRRVAHLLRWRPDRTPASCTYDQLEVAAPVELTEVLGAR